MQGFRRLYMHKTEKEAISSIHSSGFLPDKICQAEDFQSISLPFETTSLFLY